MSTQVCGYGDFLGGSVAKTRAPKAGGPGLIPSQGIRSHMPQLYKITHFAVKIKKSPALQLRLSAAK